MAFLHRTIVATTKLYCILLHWLPAFAVFYARQQVFLDPLCNFLFLNCSNTPLVLEGTTTQAELYAPVINHYLENFVKNEDLGGSLAIFANGEPVVDVHAGFKDLRHTIPYGNQTLNQVYSTGQVIESILVAQLVDKGLLDYDENIATYWPEFAQNGKDNVRLQDLMMHQAGVHYIDDEDEENALEWAHLQDRTSWADRLARQKHHFRGNPKRAYHAVTRGWYLDEIVRRVDPQGRGLEQLAKDELMGPYPDVELYFGQLPRVSDWDKRLSPTHDYPWLRLVGRLWLPHFLQTDEYLGFPDLAPLHPLVSKITEEGSDTVKAFFPRMTRHLHEFRTKEAHHTPSTSFSLKTNARSLARLMSMMANKGTSHNSFEPRLMSLETYELATRQFTEMEDLVLLESITVSQGGWLRSHDFFPGLEDVLVQGWGGADGSLAVWIEELQLGFSYVTNAMGAPVHIIGDERAKSLLLLAVQSRKRQLGLPDTYVVRMTRNRTRLDFTLGDVFKWLKKPIGYITQFLGGLTLLSILFLLFSWCCADTRPSRYTYFRTEE